MNLRIHYYGDPVLRQAAPPMDRVDDELRRLAGDMIETMRANEGVGLAAQQIGKALSVCVVEVPEELDKDEEGNRLHPDLAMPMILVNPVIADSTKKTDSREEGCLSFPEIRANIVRPQEITVRYQDEHGQPRELRARRFLARVIQHEVDHLNGVLFIDRMSAPKRIALAGKLKRLKREYGPA